MKRAETIMKKTIAAALALCAAVPSLMFTAQAAEKPAYPFGDANHSGSVTVLDATRVQRALASLTTMSPYEKYTADVDADGLVTITDATYIQRYMAKLITAFPADEEEGRDEKALRYAADFEESVLSEDLFKEEAAPDDAEEIAFSEVFNMTCGKELDVTADDGGNGGTYYIVSTKEALENALYDTYPEFLNEEFAENPWSDDTTAGFDSSSYDDAFFEENALVIFNLHFLYEENFIDVKSMAVSAENKELLISSCEGVDYGEIPHAASIICYNLAVYSLKKDDLKDVETALTRKADAEKADYLYGDISWSAAFPATDARWDALEKVEFSEDYYKQDVYYMMTVGGKRADWFDFTDDHDHAKGRVALITSVDEMVAFTTADVAKKYDNDFFEENAVIGTAYVFSSGGFGMHVSRILKDDNDLYVEYAFDGLDGPLWEAYSLTVIFDVVKKADVEGVTSVTTLCHDLDTESPSPVTVTNIEQDMTEDDLSGEPLPAEITAVSYEKDYDERFVSMDAENGVRKVFLVGDKDALEKALSCAQTAFTEGAENDEKTISAFDAGKYDGAFFEKNALVIFVYRFLGVRNSVEIKAMGVLGDTLYLSAGKAETYEGDYMANINCDTLTVYSVKKADLGAVTKIAFAEPSEPENT